MKELLKKASLTVATACLIAGGLVSVGWAASTRSERAVPSCFSTSSELQGEEAGQPEEITVNGQVYRLASKRGPVGPSAAVGTCWKDQNGLIGCW